MMSLVLALDLQFDQMKNSGLAGKQAAYMRNKFAFLGIPKPLLNQSGKGLFNKYPVGSNEELTELLLALWGKSYREYHYVACHLAYRYRKLWSLETLLIFEYMIRRYSWWDTVDEIAARLIGALLIRFPLLIERMDQWIEDDCLWIRRSALLFQLKWKADTDTDRLALYCQKTMHEKDFFIRKAIGWCLREYSKTNPVFVRDFIETHRSKLSPLSIKEGGKYLDNTYISKQP